MFNVPSGSFAFLANLTPRQPSYPNPERPHLLTPAAFPAADVPVGKLFGEAG